MRHDGHGHLGLVVDISAVMDLIFEVSHVKLMLDLFEAGPGCVRNDM